VILPQLTGAFLAGLVGSGHCIAMCGPLAASCTRTRTGLPAWHLGRVLAYGSLGAVAGAVGRTLPGPAWIPALVASLFLAWFAGGLAGLLPEPRLIPARLARLGAGAAARPALGPQFLFGVANGFLPCGLVYAALGIAISQADPLGGAAAMLAFGAGTVPALTAAALGFRRLLAGRLAIRRWFALLVLVTGLWTVWSRARSGPELHHRHETAPPAPAP
jgi:sulfite exporter TauE/SafE